MATGTAEQQAPTNLSERSKVEVSVGEVLPHGHVERDLGVVIVIAQLQVLAHVVLDHEGLVAVQTAAATVGEQQRGDGLQVALTQRRDQALVKAQLVQEDLEPQRGTKELQIKARLDYEGCFVVLRNSGSDL